MHTEKAGRAPQSPVGAVNEVDNVNVGLAGVGYHRDVDGGGRLVTDKVETVADGEFRELRGRWYKILSRWGELVG